MDERDRKKLLKGLSIEEVGKVLNSFNDGDMEELFTMGVLTKAATKRIKNNV